MNKKQRRAVRLAASKLDAAKISLEDIADTLSHESGNSDPAINYLESAVDLIASAILKTDSAASGR